MCMGDHGVRTYQTQFARFFFLLTYFSQHSVRGGEGRAEQLREMHKKTKLQLQWINLHKLSVSFLRGSLQNWPYSRELWIVASGLETTTCFVYGDGLSGGRRRTMGRGLMYIWRVPLWTSARTNEAFWQSNTRFFFVLFSSMGNAEDKIERSCFTSVHQFWLWASPPLKRGAVKQRGWGALNKKGRYGGSAYT